MTLENSCFPPTSMNRVFPILKSDPADPAGFFFLLPSMNASLTTNRNSAQIAQPNWSDIH